MRIRLAVSCLAILSCFPGERPRTEVQITRFEKEIFPADEDFDAGIDQAMARHPEFFRVYVENILALGKLDDSSASWREALKRYLGNESIRGLYRTVGQKFPGLRDIEVQLGEAFYNIKSITPGFRQPEVYSFVSEFFFSAITYDSGILGIGLDMHLGKDYPYYASVGKPGYLLRQFTPEYIVPNAVRTVLMNMFPLPEERSRFIDRLAYEGKIMYLLRKALPGLHDTLLTGYRETQLQWCRKSEAAIWTFFIKRDVLYSSNSLEYSRYLTEGPATQGMPPESPGYIGRWLGWQIVNKVMNENETMTIHDLIRLEDGQELLNLSGYKPN